MSKSLVKIRARLIGTQKSFLVTVEVPQRDSRSGDFYCRVTSSKDIAFRLDVYGVTPQQAIKLALEMTAAKMASILSSDQANDLNQENSTETE